jgi:hypothetical protein
MGGVNGRIFTVTGASVSCRMAATSSPMRCGQRSSAAPAPLFRTLGTEQPQFRSSREGWRGASSLTAAARARGSEPNNCTPQKVSFSARASRAQVGSPPGARPSAETISVKHMKAPCSTHSARKAASV